MGRATYLDRAQHQLLQDWARTLRTMSRDGHGLYLVGSAIHRPDWRDVDVRLMLDDDAFDAVAAVLDIDRLGIVVSLWGRQVTGLPIDFQIQRTTDANERHDGRRHALGLGPSTAVGDGVR